MKTCIYRIYTNKDGKKERHLQGKVFRPEGYSFDVYYRDVYPKKSTLWKTRYEKPESESLNIDHLVFDFLLKHGVKEIHYYIKPKRQLFAISLIKADRHVKLQNIKVEKLNNHTQLFIPYSLFTRKNRDYKAPWITAETSINDLLRQENEDLKNTPIGYSKEGAAKICQAWKDAQNLPRPISPKIISFQQLTIL
jgi:hypothetical protein